MLSPLFAALRDRWGRSRLRDLKIDSLLILAMNLEKTMTATKNELLEEIKAVKDAVLAHIEGRAEEIDAAVAKAKAAWEADNQDEHDAAMAELEEIRKSVAQPPFQPSAN